MIIATAPTVEPLTLPETKLHLRIITDPADVSVHPEDGKVLGLISTARELAEQHCNRAFAQATFKANGAWFDVPLVAPVTAITSVKYIDTAGVEQTLPPTVYALNPVPPEPVLQLKFGQTWPQVNAQDDAVRVEFTAGPEPAAVPPLVKAAMLLCIGTLYEWRADVSAARPAELPYGALALLQPYRVGLGV